MTHEQLEMARNDFIGERIAIMIHDAGMDEKTATEQAQELWLRYRKQFKVYANDQRGMI